MIHFRAQIVSQSIWVQWTKQAKKNKTNLLRTRKYLKINTELKQYSWRNKQLLSNPVVKLLQQTTLKKIISKFQFLADFGLILLLLIFNLSTVRTLLESGGWGVWKPQWLVPSWHDRNIAKHYTSFQGDCFSGTGLKSNKYLKQWDWNRGEKPHRNNEKRERKAEENCETPLL